MSSILSAIYLHQAHSYIIQEILLQPGLTLSAVEEETGIKADKLNDAVKMVELLTDEELDELHKAYPHVKSQRYKQNNQ